MKGRKDFEYFIFEQLNKNVFVRDRKKLIIDSIELNLFIAQRDTRKFIQEKKILLGYLSRFISFSVESIRGFRLQ